MNKLANLFLERWAVLGARDRASLMLLGAALAIAVLLFGVIGPLSLWQQRAAAALASAQAVHQEIRSLAPVALALGGAPQSFDANRLNSEVRRQAARYGLVIQRFEPDGQGLKVWLENARYPNTVQWLGALESVGIGHIELALDKRPLPGLVNVRVIFKISS